MKLSTKQEAKQLLKDKHKKAVFCSGKYAYLPREEMEVVDLPGVRCVWMGRRKDKFGVYGKLMCVVEGE